MILQGHVVECDEGIAMEDQAKEETKAETIEQEKKEVQEIENKEKKAESERRAVVWTQFDVQGGRSREEVTSKRRNDRLAPLERDLVQKGSLRNIRTK